MMAGGLIAKILAWSAHDNAYPLAMRRAAINSKMIVYPSLLMLVVLFGSFVEVVFGLHGRRQN